MAQHHEAACCSARVIHTALHHPLPPGRGDLHAGSPRQRKALWCGARHLAFELGCYQHRPRMQRAYLEAYQIGDGPHRPARADPMKDASTVCGDVPLSLEPAAEAASAAVVRHRQAGIGGLVRGQPLQRGEQRPARRCAPSPTPTAASGARPGHADGALPLMGTTRHMVIAPTREEAEREARRRLCALVSQFHAAVGAQQFRNPARTFQDWTNSRRRWPRAGRHAGGGARETAGADRGGWRQLRADADLLFGTARHPRRSRWSCSRARWRLWIRGRVAA